MSPGLLIFGGIIMLIVAIVLFFTFRDGGDGRGACLAFSAIFFILGIICIGLGIYARNHFVGVKMEVEDHTTTTPIISVSNSTSTDGSGNFNWGSGSFVIATGEVYRYYYETPEGIRQGTVPANDTVIKYTDEPPVLRHIYFIAREVKTWLPNIVHVGEDIVTSYYELLIPEGSVVNQFNLN